MADPIITNGIRALMVWQGTSGLPEDRFVNSWAFDAHHLPTDEDLEDTALRITEFYGLAASPSTNRVGVWMAGSAMVETESEIRCYRMAESPPREASIFPYVGATHTVGNNYPAEVALCVSFYSDRNIAGQRGRLYIGPLSEGAGQTDGEGACRPLDTFRLSVRNAALRLCTDTTSVTWSILTASGLLPVTGGWVDDAFDTQRRRGHGPTTRETFVAP